MTNYTFFFLFFLVSVLHKLSNTFSYCSPRTLNCIKQTGMSITECVTVKCFQTVTICMIWWKVFVHKWNWTKPHQNESHTTNPLRISKTCTKIRKQQKKKKKKKNELPPPLNNLSCTDNKLLLNRSAGKRIINFW